MTERRALVLGGGGLAGIAWETGVLLGIREENPHLGRALLDSDVVVGTSAGSAVGAQITGSLSLDELYERQLAAESAEIDPGVAIDDIAELFLAAMLTPGATRPEKLQKIGAVAAQTATVTEEVRRQVIAQRLPEHHWPDRDLRVTAIDIDTGELVAFDRAAGVDLVDAVAASCAVPAAWPPVTIDGRRYMDGGVASTVNMAVAGDCDVAVVLVPAGADTPSPWGLSTADEIAAAGRALAVFADADALAAFGRNPLDPACRIPSARAGRAQGRREAARIAAFLGL
ncbi:patatin-like phospholipase family protein [[Mycobacterium] wendilense]|uniref:Patatin-like phospholipase family protein n=1 Tax=[Mycobacterium] wendilense TaxID=3064284 RepID=A0ABN9NWT6_9MYCO|nr:patatin-like phospholipase family protein [Mycolicibacterium sp. MU0050]CAJ1580382.1 patatin-like phospholipase family protein [Mycolicibacterium sp. MU0050]